MKFILLTPIFVVSQSDLKGMVMELNPQNKHIPLFGQILILLFVYGPIFGSTYYAGLRYKLN